MWVVDDSLEMSEGSLREHRKKKGADREGGRKGKRRLVGLIAVIVGEITAHPSDLAELFALCPSEDFKVTTILQIDEPVLVLVGPLRIRVKRGADRECLKYGVH